MCCYKARWNYSLAHGLVSEPVLTAPEHARVPRPPMRLISIPASPVPEDAATAMLKTPDGVLLRYARWAARWEVD